MGISDDRWGPTVRRVIEWRANRPKWEQIADVIRERIADGTYPPDSPVPSEHKIVQEFGVDRGTARKVLDHLRETGVTYASGVWARSWLGSPIRTPRIPTVPPSAL